VNHILKIVGLDDCVSQMFVTCLWSCTFLRRWRLIKYMAPFLFTAGYLSYCFRSEWNYQGSGNLEPHPTQSLGRHGRGAKGAGLPTETCRLRPVGQEPLHKLWTLPPSPPAMYLRDNVLTRTPNYQFSLSDYFTVKTKHAFQGVLYLFRVWNYNGGSTYFGYFLDLCWAISVKSFRRSS